MIMCNILYFLMVPPRKKIYSGYGLVHFIPRWNQLKVKKKCHTLNIGNNKNWHQFTRREIGKNVDNRTRVNCKRLE